MFFALGFLIGGLSTAAAFVIYGIHLERRTAQIISKGQS